MILPPANNWGTIRGKLKTTPTQALKQFNFVQNPLALGVIIRQYTYLDDNNHPQKGLFISNYFPPSDPHSPGQQACRDRFRTVQNMALQNKAELINPIWDPLAKAKGSHGCNEFKSINLSRIGTPPDYTKLIISMGTLFPTPSIGICWIDPESKLNITFDPYTTNQGSPSDIVYAYCSIKTNGQNELKKLYLDTIYYRENGSCKGFFPCLYPPPDIIVFIYFRQNEIYSPSTSKTL